MSTKRLDLFFCLGISPERGSASVDFLSIVDSRRSWGSCNPRREKASQTKMMVSESSGTVKTLEQ